jgi:hypothetical protein
MSTLERPALDTPEGQEDLRTRWRREARPGRSYQRILRALDLDAYSFYEARQNDPEFARLVAIFDQMSDYCVIDRMRRDAMAGKTTSQTAYARVRGPSCAAPGFEDAPSLAPRRAAARDESSGPSNVHCLPPSVAEAMIEAGLNEYDRLMAEGGPPPPPPGYTYPPPPPPPGPNRKVRLVELFIPDPPTPPLQARHAPPAPPGPAPGSSPPSATPIASSAPGVLPFTVGRDEPEHHRRKRNRKRVGGPSPGPLPLVEMEDATAGRHGPIDRALGPHFISDPHRHSEGFWLPDPSLDDEPEHPDDEPQPPVRGVSYHRLRTPESRMQGLAPDSDTDADIDSDLPPAPPDPDQPASLHTGTAQRPPASLDSGTAARRPPAGPSSRRGKSSTPPSKRGGGGDNDDHSRPPPLPDDPIVVWLRSGLDQVRARKRDSQPDRVPGARPSGVHHPNPAHDSLRGPHRPVVPQPPPPARCPFLHDPDGDRPCDHFISCPFPPHPDCPRRPPGPVP